jgi:hypothetical protein
MRECIEEELQVKILVQCPNICLHKAVISFWAYNSHWKKEQEMWENGIITWGSRIKLLLMEYTQLSSPPGSWSL